MSANFNSMQQNTYTEGFFTDKLISHAVIECTIKTGGGNSLGTRLVKDKGRRQSGNETSQEKGEETVWE